METKVQTKSYIEELRREKYRKIVIIFLVFFIAFLGYISFVFYQQRGFREARLNDEGYAKKNKKAYLESLIGNNPKPLQETFLADVKNGINDEFTRSDAYFLTHRYFDNGGNVYEIYDYVESHPELAFLKEAEDIYPNIFEQIRNKTLPSVPYSTSSLYGVLAYLEVLDKHGYADVAALGTLANQYAKTAYFIKKRFEGNDVNESMTASIVNFNAKKAVFFALKTRESAMKLAGENDFSLNDLKGRPKFIERRELRDILAHNLLVGMNQYAAALRYLEAAGTDIAVIESDLNAAEIFAFDMTLSRQFVPELEIFTSLLNASTLSLVSPGSTDALRIALQPILEFDTNRTKPEGIIIGIINAKDSKFDGLDIYSKINITTLGNLVPEFKEWLISNGWKESDFDLGK